MFAGVEAFDHLHAVDQRRPGLAAVGRFMHAAARHAEIQMLRIARIDIDRMHRRPVRRAALIVAPHRLEDGIVVDRGDRRPAVAAVFAAEQALRAGAGIPHARLAGVARRQPEGVLHAAALAVRILREGRRLLGFRPVLSEIGGAEQGRAQMPGRGRGQQRAAVARVEHQMIDDVAQEMRPVRLPFPARGIALEDPCALARGDQQGCARFGGGASGRRFLCARFGLRCCASSHAVPPSCP